MILGPYVFLASIVLGVNIIPAFMPPTWIVLAFFVAKYDLNIIPVVLLGAVFATTGRIMLSELSKTVFRKFLPQKNRENYAHVGSYMNKYQHVTIPIVFAYAFLPIPSNHIFIAAGLAKARMKLLSVSFFIGRLLSYTFWVTLTKRLTDNLTDIFSHHLARTGTIVLEVAGLLFLYLLGTIAWKKILKKIEE